MVAAKILGQNLVITGIIASNEENEARAKRRKAQEADKKSLKY
jgi:hypothetical protein